MDPQTYLATYRATEARRAAELELRRQIGDRREHQAHRRTATHRSRGVAKRRAS